MPAAASVLAARLQVGPANRTDAGRTTTSSGSRRRCRPTTSRASSELRRHSPVPIATGEVLTRRQSFRPLFEQKCVDIIQPDCTKCGGLTEAWRIAWMAYEHNVQWVPHGWNTAIGLAADLQLAAAMPVAPYVEYLTPSPYMDELITQPFRPDADGFLTIPDKPGLGIELNREALKRFGS